MGRWGGGGGGVGADTLQPYIVNKYLTVGDKASLSGNFGSLLYYFIHLDLYRNQRITQD